MKFHKPFYLIWVAIIFLAFGVGPLTGQLSTAGSMNTIGQDVTGATHAVSGHAQPSVETTEYFERGLELKEEGEWKEALYTWIEAWNKFDRDQADPRIGSAFMQLVTEQRADQYYPTASEIYKWGLSGSIVTDFREHFLQELEHMKPLLDDETFDEWHEYLDRGDSELLTEIKRFWVDRDPSPHSDMNERLIEHWERLNHARQQFTVNESTGFQTDDRGKIYLKYGEPDSIETGDLGGNYGKMFDWAREFVRDQDVDPTRFQNNLRGEAAFMNWISEEKLADNITHSIVDQSFMRNYEQDFEVWIYEDMQTSSRRNLIYMFGYPAHSNEFQRIDTPEDFIAPSAFRQRSHAGSGVQFNYGPLFQLSVYDNLKFVDDYFLDAFHELENFLYMEDEPMYSESAAQRLNNRFRQRMNRIHNAAPESKSIYDNNISDIETQVQTIRLFDEDMNPYYLLFTYSEPRDLIISDHYDLVTVDRDAESNFRIRHSLSLRDDAYEVTQTSHDVPDYRLREDIEYEEHLLPTSIFKVRADVDNLQRVEFTSEVFNFNRADYMSIDNEYYHIPEDLIGVGSKSFSPDTIPSLSKTDLEISDLVVGYRRYAEPGEPETESQEQLNANQQLEIPFYVPYRNIIPYGTDLHLLFELYNLEIGENNYSRFTVNYQVRKKDHGNWFTNLFRSDDADIQTSITLNLESPNERTREHLTVESSQYTPGSYELTMVITDQQTGEQVERSQTFEVIEHTDVETVEEE